MKEHSSLGEPRPSDQHVRAALKSLAQEGAIERDPPISQGEARGRAHRWRLAPEFSSDGNTLSRNQTSCEEAPRRLPAWAIEELRRAGFEPEPTGQDATGPPDNRLFDDGEAQVGL
jgi:hypothetical protein